MADSINDVIEELRRLETSLFSQLQSSRLAGGGSLSLGNPFLKVGRSRPSVSGSSRMHTLFRRGKNKYNTSYASSNSEAGNSSTTSGVAASDLFNLEDLKIAVPTLSTNRKENSNVTDISATEHNDTDDNDHDDANIFEENTFGGTDIFGGANCLGDLENSKSLVGKFDLLFGKDLPDPELEEQFTNTFSNKKNVKFGNIVTSDEENNYTTTSGGGNMFFTRVTEDAPVEFEEPFGKEPNAKFTDESQKRKYCEIATGVTILNCKLFTLVDTHSEEHGRGTLCLNDSRIEYEGSHLMFTAGGNERCLLNAKVSAGMVAERQDKKTLKLTARDSYGESKKYLIRAKPKKITQLYSALIDRIDYQRKAQRAKLILGN